MQQIIKINSVEHTIDADPQMPAAKGREAGGEYADAPPDGVTRNGDLVTGFAWSAHPQFLAVFLEILGARVSL